MLIIYLAGFLLHLTSAAKLPRYLRACKLTDPNLNECAKRSANDGLPDVIKGDKKLQVPILSPLKLDVVNINVENSLKMNFANLSIKGLEQSFVEEFSIDAKNRHWTVRMSVPALEMFTTYSIQGRILILPITGSGDGYFKFDNIIFTYDMDYEISKNHNGTEFMRITKHKLTYVPKKVEFHLKNLFGGDERLGTEMNKFLNENWPEVNKQISPGLSETMNTVTTSVVNAYLNSVPYRELLLM